MKKIIISAAVLIAAVSCQEAIITDKADGAIAVHIETSAAVEVVTKADANTVSPDNFAVYVKSGDNLIKSFAKYVDMPDQIKVPAGEYVVSAENVTIADSFKSADDSNDPWGQVRYSGQSAPIEVKAGETATECSFTCTMANTALSIDFGENIRYHFSEIKVTAATANSRSLEYTTATTQKVGYFSPETLTYTFVGKYLDEEIPMSITGTRALQAATHLHLTFDISEQNGTIGKPTITVIADCEDLNETITVDPSENGSFVDDNVTE